MKVRFLEELNFWGLNYPKSYTELKLSEVFSCDYQSNPHRGCSEELLLKWRELGPIDLSKWVDEDRVSLDSSKGIQTVFNEGMSQIG